jgi:hypothetical protein
MNNFRPMVG